MKKVQFLLIVLSIIACTKSPVKPADSEIPTPDSPVLSADSVMVSLKAVLDFSEEPLTKASSQDDLYGLRVYQLIYDGRDDCWNVEPVAYGTFDDLSKVVVKMAKAFKYGIDLTYIPNGKNLVYSDSKGHYGAPFDPVWVENGDLNTVLYYTTSLGTGKPVPFLTGDIRGKNDAANQTYAWPAITRYQGSVICDPSAESTAEVKLYSQMIGFRISISDFDRGSVFLLGTFGQKLYATHNSDNTGLLDCIVCMEYLPSIVWIDNYRYVTNKDTDILEFLKDKMNYQGVSLVFKDTDGSEIILYSNPHFTTYRNTRYVMSFSLSNAIRNGGITAEVVNEGEMTDVDFPL